MPTNKLVEMAFYPVVYDTDVNNNFTLDSNGDKIIEKNKDQVNPSQMYSFVTIKELKNHGEFRYCGLRIN